MEGLKEKKLEEIFKAMDRCCTFGDAVACLLAKNAMGNVSIASADARKSV